MKNYKFDLIYSNMTGFVEKDHVIPAHSLTDAIEKFCRKHELIVPAYWDEPSFDKNIEILFKSVYGEIKYHISWS